MTFQERVFYSLVEAFTKKYPRNLSGPYDVLTFPGALVVDGSPLDVIGIRKLPAGSYYIHTDLGNYRFTILGGDIKTNIQWVGPPFSDEIILAIADDTATVDHFGLWDDLTEALRISYALHGNGSIVDVAYVVAALVLVVVNPVLGVSMILGRGIQIGTSNIPAPLDMPQSQEGNPYQKQARLRVKTDFYKMVRGGVVESGVDSRPTIGQFPAEDVVNLIASRYKVQVPPEVQDALQTESDPIKIALSTLKAFKPVGYRTQEGLQLSYSELADPLTTVGEGEEVSRQRVRSIIETTSRSPR